MAILKLTWMIVPMINQLTPSIQKTRAGISDIPQSNNKKMCGLWSGTTRQMNMF